MELWLAEGVKGGECSEADGGRGLEREGGGGGMLTGGIGRARASAVHGAGMYSWGTVGAGKCELTSVQ